MTGATGTNGNLSAQYDSTGNLVNLVVQRDGGCLGPVAKCVQRFVYDWDEIGQLARARRWDYATPPATDPPYPQVPIELPSVDLSFTYHQNQRVLKRAANPSGADTYTINVFSSLRLDGTTWDANAVDYVRNSQVESVYLGGIAHLVYDPNLPSRTNNPLHVFYETADQVASTSTVFDRDTGELVERVTNQGYGAADSDYRPDRWASFREPQRLGGNEDDIEVGLVYFGARYYSPNLLQWMSADPLSVHALASGMNPYSFMGGSPMQRVDPFGLDPEGSGSDNTGGIIGLVLGLFNEFFGNPAGWTGSGGSLTGNGSSGSVAPPVQKPTPPAAQASAASSGNFTATVGEGVTAYGSALTQEVTAAIKTTPGGIVELYTAGILLDTLQTRFPNSSVVSSLEGAKHFVDHAGDKPGPNAPVFVQVLHVGATVSAGGVTVAGIATTGGAGEAEAVVEGADAVVEGGGAVAESRLVMGGAEQAGSRPPNYLAT